MSSEHHDTLALFAKAPRPGRVKTRLAATVGDARALAIYHDLAAATCAAVDGARADRRVVYYAPADGADEVRMLCARDWEYRPQVGGDLGARMGAAFADALGDAADDGARMVLVGTDCPTLSPALLDDALAALDRSPLVFGPSDDGGYYLVGMTRAGLARAVPAIFDDVAWSTEEVLPTTLARCAAIGVEPVLLPERGDIDTWDDYQRWQAAL